MFDVTDFEYENDDLIMAEYDIYDDEITHRRTVSKWAISFCVHSFLLCVLAVIVYGQSSQEEKGAGMIPLSAETIQSSVSASSSLTQSRDLSLSK